MKKLIDYLLITAGAVIMALGLNLFLIPNKIAAGGVSGIATVLEYTAGFSPGAVVAVVNLPLFVLAFFLLGNRAVIKSVYGTAVLSVSLEYLNLFGVATNDPLLASIAGGAFVGVGMGLILRRDATTGGTDIVARMLNTRLRHVSIGKFILLIDGVIILWSALVFHDFDLMIYATLSLYLSSKLIDSIVEGGDFAKEIYIVSKRSEEIAQDINHKLNRGVTGLKSVGMYTREDSLVLMCIIRRNELSRLKEIVGLHDPNAFMILSDVREVLGEGFREF